MHESGNKIEEISPQSVANNYEVCDGRNQVIEVRKTIEMKGFVCNFQYSPVWVEALCPCGGVGVVVVVVEVATW